MHPRWSGIDKGDGARAVFRSQQLRSAQRRTVSISERRERREQFLTLSGHNVECVYTPEHVGSELQEVRFSGEVPVLHDPHPRMCRARSWRLRQIAASSPGQGERA